MTKSDSSKKSLVIVGRYQMLKVLGKGNFARVEEAVHTLLNVKVAVKVIDTGKIREDYVMKNLTREAKLLSKLRHPGVVRLYETIQCGSVYYLVIELATGGDLYTHIKNQQPLARLDEKIARGYARQLAAALEHMHSRGIVHRDLKMENIMLQDSRKEQIKIVDFGLSNIYTRENPLKTHCGSPEYAAPELFVVGKKYGPEVDLWSLGVIFYAMATGQLPFQSPRDDQTSLEERRRKLLAQINRGLTPAQKKSIATMSNEYRNLVNRLLMPVAHKRITIRELCFHPWIANKLKNLHPQKISQTELLAHEHNSVINEIAEVTSLERSIIERNVLNARFGEIGGMYNIKAHAMRQRGSLHTFRARSWTGVSHPSRYTNSQNTHTSANSRTDHLPQRGSPVSKHLNSNSPERITALTTQKRTMIFHRSLSAKPSSSGGMCNRGTWSPKERKTAATSCGRERTSTYPIHNGRYSATPEVHRSGLHRVTWEHNSDRYNDHMIPNIDRESVARSGDTQSIRVAPRRIQTSSGIHEGNRQPETTVHRDPVEQWIAEKLKSLEKRDQSRLRQISCRQSSNVATEVGYDARNYRRSPAPALAVQTLCKDIRSEESMGQGDRISQRWFRRSSAAAAAAGRTNIAKTRLSLSTATKSLEKNSRVSRPVTANENHEQSVKFDVRSMPRVQTKPANKCEACLPISAVARDKNPHRCKGSAPLPYSDVSPRGMSTIGNKPGRIIPSEKLRDRLCRLRAELNQEKESLDQEVISVQHDSKKNETYSRVMRGNNYINLR